MCNQHRRSQHVYLTDFSSLNLRTHFSVLPPNCKCLWAWKMCVLSGWYGWPPQLKEVCLLRLFGSAYYLHVFNDSYPRRVRALSQLGIFDPANYSSYLIATAICLIPPACPQWQHFTSSSYVVVCLCLVQLSYSGDWNSSGWRILWRFEPPAWDLCEEWLFCDGLEEREKM